MLKKAGNWLDQRTGWRSTLAAWTQRTVDDRSKWARTTWFGIIATFVLLAVTGIGLALHYSPSSTDAWGSVWYIQTQVVYGDVLRGLHHFGSSALVVLCVLHLVQIFLAHGYRRPYELRWFAGVLTLFLCFGFTLTGYLLPYDQDALWGTTVRTQIMGSIPLLGPAIQEWMVGGHSIGNLTLTRFNGLHTIVLPLVTICVLIFGSFQYRRKMEMASEDTQASEPVSLYWPVQACREAVFFATVVAIILALTLIVGAPLLQPADPTSAFEARPEWFFRSVFELLHYFEGPMAVVGTVVIPGIATTLLLALPFFDQTRGGLLRERLPWTFAFMGILIAASALTALSFYQDSQDEAFQRTVERQRFLGDLSLKLAEENGVNSAGDIPGFDAQNRLHAEAYQIMDTSDLGLEQAMVIARKNQGIPPEGLKEKEGFTLFQTYECSSCHVTNDHAPPGEKGGPNLTGYLSRAWYKAFLTDPMGAHHFGGLQAANDMDWDMPPADELNIETPEDLDALVELLCSQTKREYAPPINPTQVERGAVLFEDECSACHGLEELGKTGDSEPYDLDGPSLYGHGSREWLTGFLHKPDAPHYFGTRNTMPRPDGLSSEETSKLIDYLYTLQENSITIETAP